jgi:cell division protein FtsB
MVQDQIVDYINSQMKLGVSRDAIKATLTGAGWQAADVEDTLKKVEAAKVVAQPASAQLAQPVQAAQPVVASRIITPVTPASSANSAASGPQVIKMSDLVSSSAAPAMPATPPAKPAGPKSPLTGVVAPASSPAKLADTYQANTYIAPKTHGSRGPLITEIILGVIIVVIAALAGFLYMQNKSLTTQVGSLNGQSSGVASQLSALQAQVAASTTALTAQVASLDSEMQEYQAELSFFVASTSTPAGATSTTTVEGVVFVGKSSYVITAAYGAKILVANSKDGAVVTALTPLLAGTSTPATAAQFSGTYVPGSDSMTLTAVNGTAVQ